ncbi:MAG: GGDEF domain-containing protein, partial [Solirubrobacteraceae bacterium]
LVAVGRSRTRAAAAVALAVVLAPAVAVASAVRHTTATPPTLLLIGVGVACAVVVVELRERVEREREAMREFALRDAVTGIANRRSLLIRAGYEVERHRRARRSFALVMLDLDGFKQLNDRFGHAAGDDLLRDVAAALARGMRAQDTVARLGGDEFCVLAPETGERGGELLARKVVEVVRAVSAGIDAVSGSAGLAIFPFDGETAEELMKAADERLLEAKRERYRGQARRPARRAA